MTEKTNKRQYSFNYHDNSDDFKNLGQLHKQNRTVDYFPQDEKQDFSSKPQILGKEHEQLENMSMSNASSRNEKLSRRNQSSFSLASDDREVKGFPKTTNQDFHSDVCHIKARELSQLDRQNFKRTNPYMSFVNANFNQGVFVNPWQDQV